MNNKIQNFLKYLISLLLILILIGCSEKPSSEDKDGRITVNMLNFNPGFNGKNCYVGIFAKGTDHTIDPALEILTTTFNSGGGSVTSINVFPEGSRYEIWIFIDINDNADPDNPIPEDGIDFTIPFSYDVIIDGDQMAIIDPSILT